MLHCTSTSHYSSLFHHHALAPIPNFLMESLGEYTSPCLHILPGQRDVTITASITPISTLLHSQFDIPIYEHDAKGKPSSRICQNSRIQITTSGNMPSYTTNLLHVRGSRGFTNNYKYENLELVDSFTPGNLHVVWLQVALPHIHLNVVLINDDNNPNRRRHNMSLSLFEGEMMYSQETELEDCLREQQSMLTWKAIQQYSMLVNVKMLYLGLLHNLYYACSILFWILIQIRCMCALQIQQPI